MHFFSPAHRQFVEALFGAIQAHYGSQLVTLAVFGSYARGAPRANSDLDLFIVLKHGDPIGRCARTQDFVRAIELPLDPLADAAAREGIVTEISPLILTRAEAGAFIPLYLDMVGHHHIIVDQDHFLRQRLQKVKKQMQVWGSKRCIAGNHWYWQIKPGMRWGEVLNYDE